MNEIDVTALQDFVGREEERSDMVNETSLLQFRNTLAPYLLDEAVEAVPPGFHWTLFQPVAPIGDLGADGHPKALGILPEMPLSARMWAGGEVTFHASLQVADRVHRQTRVEKIEAKEGGSGPLLFVTLAHEISSGESVLVRERQGLVYRNPTSASLPKDTVTNPSHGTPFETDSRLLFRYSALTFNSHRIHYDQAYATDVEGYPALVVHGPLQATLLVNHIARTLGHSRLKLSYRGVAPLFVGQRAHMCVTDGMNGEAWVERGGGDVTMRGRFEGFEGV
jgi:3-methylfumaryl-CoA hydratase